MKTQDIETAPEMVQVGFEAPKELDEFFRAEAARRDMSKSAMYRQAAKEFALVHRTGGGEKRPLTSAAKARSNSR